MTKEEAEFERKYPDHEWGTDCGCAMCKPRDPGKELDKQKEEIRHWLDRRFPPMTEIIKGQDFTQVGFENERRQIVAIIAEYLGEVGMLPEVTPTYPCKRCGRPTNIRFWVGPSRYLCQECYWHE